MLFDKSGKFFVNHKYNLVFLLLFVLLLTSVYAGNFLDNTESDFENGIYVNTSYNSTFNAVVLNSSFLKGSYASEIFDAGENSTWSSILWGSDDGEFDVGLSGNILLMHLNEQSGTIIDYSSNSNNGSYNGALYNQEGQINSAIGFDGSDDLISINDSGDLNFGTDDFSISFWIKRDSTGTQGLTSKGTFDAEGFGLFFTGQDKIRLRAESDVIDAPTDPADGTYSFTPSDGWTHVTVVADRDGNISFYKNASLTYIEDISSASTTDISSSDNFSLGYIINGAGDKDYFFDGDMDEFVVYNRTLSEDEIGEHYARGIQRLNLSVRSCNDSSCSGESWIDVSDSSPQSLSVSDNRYFQYLFNFTTPNVNYIPKLYNVSVDYSELVTEGDSGTYLINEGSTRYSFLSGTLMNVSFNNSVDALELNSSSGLFLSQVFDATSLVSWDIFSWISSPMGELDSGLEDNILLLHLNEESGNFIDYSGYGNNATNHGVDYSYEGRFNKSVYFNETDYFQIEDDSEFYNPGGFSVHLWFKDNGSSSVLMDLISKYDNLGETEWYFSADKSTGKIYYTKFGNGGSIQRETSSTDLFDGEWHSIVATWNGSVGNESISIYLDSVKVDNQGTDTGFTGDDDRNAVIKVGKNTALNNQDLNAFIDEISLWNKSLSQSEVSGLYRRGINSIDFSVRSCDDFSCSGESWTDINDVSSQNLSLTDNRYIQYKGLFETENTSYFPLLYNVSITYSGINHSISFVSPTPSDGDTINESSVEINATTDVGQLNELIFNWNDLNYTIYDSNTKLFMNFDNVSSLGENSTLVKDLTNLTNEGILKNGAFIESGKYGNSVYLDATDDHVDVEDEGDLNFGTNDFSILFWVNRSIDDSGPNGILSKGTFDAEGFGLFFTATSSGNKIRLRAESDAIDTSSVSGLSFLPSDGWTHIAVIADRDGNISFYKNGVLSYTEDISSASATDISSSDNFKIGYIRDETFANEYYLGGNIDNLAIHKKAISEEELQQHYYSNLYKYDSTNWVFYSNVQDLCNDTSYNYSIYARDSLNNLISTEIRTLNVGNVTESVSGTITISTPVKYTIVQRDSENKSNISISGSYTGNPSTIEARFNGGDWSEIVSSPDGGSFEGNLTNQSVGQGILEVRFSNNNSIVDSVEQIGIGDLYAISGQSNARMTGYNLQNYNTSLGINATVYREDDAWKIANDPIHSTSSDGSSWPLLANHLVENTGIPIGYISAAAGGSSILEWQRGDSYYDHLVDQIDEATGGTRRIKAVIWFQGERDARTDAGCYGNYDCFKNNLSQFTDDLISDLNADAVIVGQIDHQPNGNRTTNDNIRKAQQELWDENSNVKYGPVTYDIGLLPDNLHFKTDEQLQEFADRWWAALSTHYYGGSFERGPRIQSAQFDLSSNKITLEFDKNLNVSSGSEGWRIVDGGIVLTDSNITSSSVGGSTLILNLNTALNEGSVISLGSSNDAQEANVPRETGEFSLPGEMIFSYNLSFVDQNISFVSPTPSDNENIIYDFFEINASISASNLTSTILDFDGINYTFYDETVKLFMNFDNVSSLGENSTLVKDLSSYSNEGVIDGAYPVNGRHGGAFEFDGVDDLINVSDSDSLNLELNNFTIEMWLKRNSIGTQGLLTKTHPTSTVDSSDGFAVYIDSSDYLHLVAQDWEINAVSSQTLGGLNEWVHLAIVVERLENSSNPSFKSNNVTFYKNGVNIGEDETLTLIHQDIASSYNFRIGLKPDTGDYFNGSIDELRIFETAFDSEEIFQHYNSNLNKLNSNQWYFYSNQTSLSDGTYNFTVFAEDGLSLVDSGVRSVNVDSNAPSLEIISPLAQIYSTNSSSFNVSSNENLSFCKFSLDNWQTNYTMNSFNSTYFYYINSSMLEGSYTAKFWCNDSYNHINDTESVTFEIDTLSPDLTIVSPLNQAYTNNSINFEVQSNKNLSFCKFSLDNWQTNYTMQINSSLTDANYTNSSVADGSYTAKFWCNDTSGYESNPTSISFSVDTVAPLITSPSHASTISLSSSTTSYTLSLETSENATCRYNSSDLGWENMVPLDIGGSQNHNQTFTGLSSGNTYTYYFLCEDSAGNRMSSSHKLYISVASLTSNPSSGDTSGGGGGGGGGIAISPSSLNDVLSISGKSDILVNPGEKKTQTWNVKNTKWNFLNDCTLKGSGDYEDWISYSGSKNLASGEQYTFVFNVKPPVATKEGKYNVSVVFECNEMNQTEEFSLTILEQKINFDLRDVTRISEEEVLINYTLTDYSGFNQDVSLQFLLFNWENNKIAEITETSFVEANSQINLSTIVSIDAKTKGVMELVVNINSEDYSGFVQEEVVLGAPISGFSIKGVQNRLDDFASAVFVAIFLLVGFIVFRKIIKKKFKKKSKKGGVRIIPESFGNKLILIKKKKSK